MSTPSWPPPGLPVGLGCLRLSEEVSVTDDLAVATVRAAVEAGVTVFDTAHAYGPADAPAGHNERLLAKALRLAGARDTCRIVTKGGMSRPGGAWVPDGRAKAIRADCEASLEALDGLPVDLYLLHAPDPRVPWATSLRALARLVDEGLVPRVGVSNVNRAQLDAALELVPVAAVQVALSPYDDRAVRGGVLERCEERGLALLAHSPLGGPRRTRRLGRVEAIAEVARSLDATPAQVALAWLLDLSPVVVPIPGARRPESAMSAASAASLELTDLHRETLRRGLGGRRTPVAAAPAKRGEEVVLVMGIPGAGKSRVAEGYARRGFVRLNRDQRGGSLRSLEAELERNLGEGTRRIVLDNTYLTRAARYGVVSVAAAHGLPARCVWLDTDLAQAQVNLVGRLLDRFGGLPTPEDLRAAAREEPGLMAPTSQMRSMRELEAPDVGEGFVAVQRVPFSRDPFEGPGGVVVTARALERPGWHEVVTGLAPGAPHLVLEWRPGATPEVLAEAVAQVAAVVTGPVQAAVCGHPGGPPVCWCRPPLPGLPLAFARAHGLDPRRCFVVGVSPAHHTLATTLGARYVPVAG